MVVVVDVLVLALVDSALAQGLPSRRVLLTQSPLALAVQGLLVLQEAVYQSEQMALIQCFRQSHLLVVVEAEIQMLQLKTVPMVVLAVVKGLAVELALSETAIRLPHPHLKAITVRLVTLI